MNNLRNKVYKLLRQSERIFKTDMVYLAKGGFWLTSNQFIVAITSFLLSVVFAHLLSKEDFGNYKYVIAIAGIISTFSLTGLGGAVAQSVARGFEGSLIKGFKENIKWSFGVILISLAIFIYYFLNGNLFLAISMLVVGIAQPLINSASLYTSFLSGKKDFKSLTIYISLSNIFPTILLISVLIIHPSALVTTLTYFLANAFISIILFRNTVKKHLTQRTEDPGMMSFAKHLSLLTVLNSIAEQIDKVIVFHYIGAAQLAIYTFATAIPLQIKGALKGAYQLALPKFAVNEVENIKKGLPSKMMVFSIFTTIFIGLYIISAPYIYKLFFPQYTSAIKMSQIFSLSILAYVSIIPGAIMQSHKMIRNLYRVNTSMAVIKISFLFIGLAFWGVWGVIFARIINEFAGLLIVSFFVFREKN